MERAVEINMAPTERERFERVLKDKAKELSDRLRSRDGINIEAVPDEADLVQLASIRELEIETLHRDTGLLREVRAALARLADGVFGVCLLCGREIGRKRLEAIPWAPYCVACQETVDREGLLSPRANPDEMAPAAVAPRMRGEQRTARHATSNSGGVDRGRVLRGRVAGRLHQPPGKAG